MKHETEFKTHNVAGNYCWDCRIKTRPGVPGWKHGVRSGGHIHRGPFDSNAHGGYCEGVVWANGDETKRDRPCGLCGKYCGNPVEDSFLSGRDSYREVVKSRIV